MFFVFLKFGYGSALQGIDVLSWLDLELLNCRIVTPSLPWTLLSALVPAGSRTLGLSNLVRATTTKAGCSG